MIVTFRTERMSIGKEIGKAVEYTKEQLKKLRDIEFELYHELSRICKKHHLRFVTGFGTTLGAIRHHGFIPWDDDMDFLMPRKDYETLIKVCGQELGDKYELLEPRTKEGYVMTFAKLARKDSTFVEEVDRHLKYNTGIFIDIFPMDYWPQDKKERDRVAFRCYVLARLMVLAIYGKPKLPAGMSSWKRACSHFGCSCIHLLLKILRRDVQKLYRKYLKFACSTSPQRAEHYVTDMTWCWIRNGGMFGLQYKDKDLFTPLYVEFEDGKVPVPEKYDSYLTIAYRDYMKLPPVEKRHSHKPAILIFPEEENR